MIQVVNRAFDILEFIARDKNKIYGLTEIADGLGLNHATCANIIKTMVQRNYLEQVGHKKGYRIGFMTFQISGNSSYEQELLLAAKNEMERLTKSLNETSLLGILKKDLRIALHQVACNQDLNVKSSTEKSAYNSASGRVLIAMQDDVQLESYLEKFGLPSSDFWKEAASAIGFKKEIQKIRDARHAIQIAKSHIVGIAVPIYKNDSALASLSVYVPESRFSEKVSRNIIIALRKSADTIGKKLSGKVNGVSIL